MIWQSFIGHDGFGRMLKSKKLDESIDKKRILFAEYHYTCLESIASLDTIIKQIKNYTYNNVKNLILQNNDIIAFHAHVGRIRDCIKKIGEQFGMKNLHLRFEKGWREMFGFTWKEITNCYIGGDLPSFKRYRINRRFK